VALKGSFAKGGLAVCAHFPDFHGLIKSTRGKIFSCWKDFREILNREEGEKGKKGVPSGEKLTE